MLNSSFSVNAIKLRITYVLKQISLLSKNEQTKIIQFILICLKSFKRNIACKYKQRSTYILKHKNLDGCHKIVVRRKKELAFKKNNDLNICSEDNKRDTFSDYEDTLDLEDIKENETVSSTEPLKSPSNNDIIKSTKTNLNLYCNLCRETFNNYHYLTLHLLNHVGSALSCFECKQTFQNLTIYKIHRNQECLSFKGLAREDFLCVLTHVVQKFGQKYQRGLYCPICGCRFCKPFNLQRHLNYVCNDSAYSDKYHCTNCNKKFNEEVKYSEHLQQHTYKCLNCDMYFSTKKLLKLHSKTHPKSPKKKYTCKLCNIDVTGRAEFREHIKSHAADETEEKPWKVWCGVCNVSLHDQFTYKRHCTRKKHLSKVTEDKQLLNTKMFMCVKCGSVFMTKDALQTHCSRLHSNKPQISCDKCEYTTISKYIMSRHQLTHNKSVKKIILCDQCPSHFIASSALKEHMKSVHSDERLFACDSCPKKFKLKKLLNRHVKIHSPSLPFVCTYCNLGFKRKTHLKRHTDNRHRDLFLKPPGSEVLNKAPTVSIIEETSKPIPTSSHVIEVKDITENLPSDKIYSLIDAQSGELVTLSETELSKNAVMNIANGELLNEVGMGKTWSQPNQIYTIDDPMLQSIVMQQPEYNIITHDRNVLANVLQNFKKYFS